MTNSSRISRIGRIKSIYRTLFREAINVNYTRLILANCCGFAGLICQLLGVSVVIYYAKHLVSGELITFEQYQFAPRESLQLLIVISISAAIIFTISALCNYFYHLTLVRLSGDAEIQLLSRLNQLLSRSYSARIPNIAGSKGEASLLKIALGDSRYCARAFLMATLTFVPLFTLILSVASLFYFHWTITSVILPITAIFIFFLYRLNIYGVENSMALEKSMPAVRDSFRASLNIAAEEQLKEEVTDSREIKKYVQAYEGLISLPYRSNFVSDCFLAVTIAAVLFGLAASAIYGYSSWINIVIYIVALRYGISSLKQFSSRLTVMNRFYPQIFRYIKFVNSLKQSSRAVNEIQTVSVQSNDQSAFPELELTVSRGEPILFLFKRMLSRFNIETVIDQISPPIECHQLRRVYLVGDIQALRLPLKQPHSLRAKIRSELSLEDGKLLKFLNLFDNYEKIKADLESYLRNDQQHELSPLSLLAINLSALNDNSFDWIFISSAVVELLTEVERQRLYSLLKGSFIFIYSRDLLWDRELYEKKMPTIVMAQDYLLIWVGILGDYFKNVNQIKLPFRRDSAVNDTSFMLDNVAENFDEI